MNICYLRRFEPLLHAILPAILHANLTISVIKKFQVVHFWAQKSLICYKQLLNDNFYRNILLNNYENQ